MLDWPWSSNFMIFCLPFIFLRRQWMQWWEHIPSMPRTITKNAVSPVTYIMTLFTKCDFLRIEFCQSLCHKIAVSCTIKWIREFIIIPIGFEWKICQHNGGIVNDLEVTCRPWQYSPIKIFSRNLLAEYLCKSCVSVQWLFHLHSILKLCEISIKIHLIHGLHQWQSQCHQYHHPTLYEISITWSIQTWTHVL